MLLLKVTIARYPSIVSEDVDDSIDLLWRFAAKSNNTKRPRKQFSS